jgi:hypothetical protein
MAKIPENNVEKTLQAMRDLQRQLALLRLKLALRAFDPNQPRWPAGESDGGRWRRTGAGEGVAARIDPMRKSCAKLNKQETGTCVE